MKRTFRVTIETGISGDLRTEDFEVDDGATDAEVEEMAREIFFNQCNYGVHEITDKGDKHESKG